MKPATVLVAAALSLAACGDDAGSAVTATQEPVPGTEDERASVTTLGSLSTTVTSAAGGGATTTTVAATGVVSTTVESTAAATTEAPAPTTTRPRPDGEDAPDFTVALGQGGEFTLSAETKPVYMVFWAEW